MKRTLKFEDRAFAELTQWIQQDRKMALKITELIEAIKRDPFSGIGKPEPLKHHRKGYWSRRITQEHRLVYLVTDNSVVVASCMGHYEV